MEIGEAVGRYEQAAALLPSRWQQAAGVCRSTARPRRRSSACGQDDR